MNEIDDRPLHLRGLAALGRALEAGALSSVELTEHFLERIRAFDPALNAYRLVCEARALAAARAADEARGRGGRCGPLAGLPYAAKDLFDAAGLPTTAGTRLLADNVAERDATVIRRLDEAGMVLLGKTNTVQLAYGGAGVNNDHGTPHNPWHPHHHTPGGSSSGSGVAVAAGLAPMALGSDTGGSVRIPAALCGVTGLKTTVGQVSRAGVFPLSWTLDSVGPLARTVEDAALVYECIQGPDPDDATTAGRPRERVLENLAAGVRGLRLAFGESAFWEEVDPEVARAVREAGEVLRELGAEVRSVEFAEAEAARQLNARGLVIAAEAWTLNRRLLEEHFDVLDPVVARRMVKGRETSTDEYLHISLEMSRLRSRAIRALQGLDALLAPATAIPAAPLAELDASFEAYTRHNLLYLRNTAIGNILNLCGLSVPCGFTAEGLPIGLMIYGKPFDETRALAVGHAFQQATDWHLRAPDLEWCRGAS